MPYTLHWQGALQGTGHTSVAAYDFNVASNWKVARNNENPTYWVTSLTAPGPGDLALVGGLVVARTPLLFGGYTGTMGVGGWGPNGTTGTAGVQSGTTFTSSLFGFVCNLTPTSYPFPWLGGGITGDIYSWLFSDAIKDNAGLTNPAAISSALDISRSQAGLKLKVQERSSFLTTGQINTAFASGATTTDGYPNYSVVAINFVQSRSQPTGITAGVCSSRFVLGEAATAANTTDAGMGTVIINGGGFNEVVVSRLNNSNGTSTGKAASVTLNNTVVRSAIIPNCDFNVAADSIVGVLTVVEGYLPYYAKNKKELTIDNREITFLGKANTSLANSALGYINTASTSATGAFVSGIYLNKQYAGVNDGHYDYIPTVVIGSSIGATATSTPVTIENIQIVAAGASGAPSNLPTLRRWNILFNGNATVTTIANDGGVVSAYEDIRNDATVTIGELQMRNNAILDLTQAPNFNGWYFGSLTGGTSSNFVIGGINFLDESSIVVGSAGVRLYNTKIAAGYDFRAATDIPASKFSVFAQDFGGKK